MSEVKGGQSDAEATPTKYERKNDPDCFLEIATGESSGQRHAGYFLRDIDIRLSLTRLLTSAGTLCEKDALEASRYAANLQKERGIHTAEESIGSVSSLSHVNITFDAEITTTDEVTFGLISENGPAEYSGRVAVEIRTGREEHSQITHYEGTSDTEAVIFIGVYLSAERLEWLHRERLSRPGLTPVLRASVRAYEKHASWSFGRSKRVFLEPDSSAHIVRASFYISDASPRNSEPDELSNGSMVEEYKRWISDLRNQVTENDGKEEWQRAAHAYDHVGYSVAHWCAEHNKDAEQTKSHLSNAERFLKKLDETIYDRDYTPTKGKAIWQHVHNFKRFLHNITAAHRDDFGEDTRFAELLDEYIHSPSLQNNYLDWLILDLLLMVQCVGVYQSYMKLAHGAGFILFEGVRWKMFLWKLVMWPLAFVVGWILPAVGFYYLAQWSEGLGIGLSVLYYGAAVWMLLYGTWSKIVAVLNSMPSPKRILMNRINQIDNVYPLLAATTIHPQSFRRAFERAQDAGAGFDQRLFYILDRVQERSPNLWRTTTRGGVLPTLWLS